MSPTPDGNQWLKAQVVEPEEGGPGRILNRQRRRGTPQGGVISPLSAHVFLHRFDLHFHREAARWAGAQRVRYADDFVVLARCQGERLRASVEGFLEGEMGLEINREKTRVVNLHENGASLDFPGYTFRSDRDLHGRDKRYLNLTPAAKSVAREKEQIRAQTNHHYCFQPLPEMIEQINRQTAGWENYFKLGYPTQAFRKLNHYLTERLMQQMERRSQRAMKLPETASYPSFFKRLGLKLLGTA